MSGKSRPFHVALVQMRCSTDPDDNLRRACAMLREAAATGAQVACLPELFRTQYFCQAEDAARFDLAEPIPGPTTEALAAVARDTGMVVVGSIFEKRAPGVYHNTAVVLDADGSLRGRYRKMHIPDDPLYYEKYYFTPGDLGFQAFPTSFARVGHARLLGPVVSRSRPADGPEGGGDPLLSHGDRLASRREGRVRRGPGQRLGDDAAGPRDRQRRLRRGGQPGRPRGPGRRRSRILGRLVPGRPVRPDPRPGRPGHRGDPPSPSATRSSRKRPAATGPSSATAGSTPMRRSRSDSLIQECSIDRDIVAVITEVCHPFPELPHCATREGHIPP